MSTAESNSQREIAFAVWLTWSYLDLSPVIACFKKIESDEVQWQDSFKDVTWYWVSGKCAYQGSKVLRDFAFSSK